MEQKLQNNVDNDSEAQYFKDAHRSKNKGKVHLFNLFQSNL